MGQGGITIRTSAVLFFESPAEIASTAKLEVCHLAAEPIVDLGDHERLLLDGFDPTSRIEGLRSKRARISTWLVCGNISNVSTQVSRNPPATNILASRARVDGSQET